MIKANELRIGNWVKRAKSPLWQKRYWGEIVEAGLGTLHQPEHYEPIPITPEILEKAGFVHEVKKYSDHYILNKEKPTGKIDCLMKIAFNDSGIAYVHLTGIFGTRIPKTKYLHQLQNLYFALTGTELEIKL